MRRRDSDELRGRPCQGSLPDGAGSTAAAEVRASLPWLPLYVGDWLRETRGWPPVVRAVYLELLLAQWDEGSLPADAETLQAIARVTTHEWTTAWRVLAPFFPLDRRRRRNSALAARRTVQEDRRRRLSDAGRRGNERRWYGDVSQGDRQAIGSRSHSESESESASEREETPQERQPGRRTVVVAAARAAR